MDILSFRYLDGRGALVRAVFITAFCTVAILTTGQAKGAAPYSSEEQIYLKNITPTLYEYSQLANEVSTSAITLQSAPTAQCSGQFSYYRGLMDSFRKQLSAFDPPPRLQSVHIRAVEAIADYENGLKLYGQACVEEDFGVKEGLVERGAQYLNSSVEDMESVYAGIEKLTKSKPTIRSKEMEEDAPQEEGVLMETLSEPTAVLKETDTEPVVEATEEDTTAISPKPASEKTAEEIIKEIEMKVKAKNRTLSNEATVTSQTVYEYPRVTTPKAAPEETARAVEVAAPKTVQPDEEAIVVEQSNTEIIEPQQSVEPSPDETQTQVTVRQETRTETGRELQSADDEKSKEDKIAALNEKIMENTSAPKNQADQTQDVAVDTVTERSVRPVESSAEELTPETTVQEVEEPAVIVEEQAEVNTEASEDKISQEEKIERINKKINERIMQRGVSQDDSAGEETLVAKSESTTETVYSEEPANEVALTAPEEQEKLSAPADSEIKSWCEARMDMGSELKNCVQIRTEAKQSMNRMSEQFPPGTEAGDIIEKCKADWKEGGSYNYEMVISCTHFFCKQKGIESCAGEGQ